MRTISANSLRAVFASQTGFAVFSILHLSHSSWSSDLYIVNNNEAIVYDGNTYQPFAFKFTPPSESGDGATDTSKVIIDNVDRTIVALVRSAPSPISLRAAILMVDEDGTVRKEAGWWEFYLRNISYNSTQLSGSLLFNISLTDNVSRKTYSNIDFPGIF